jgi:hypothetical protein
VSITDPREVAMPDIGLIELEDAETGKRIVIDTGSLAVRNSYKTLGAARQGRLRDVLRSMDVDQIEVLTDRDYVLDLVRFFRSRGHRSRIS